MRATSTRISPSLCRRLSLRMRRKREPKFRGWLTTRTQRSLWQVFLSLYLFIFIIQGPLNGNGHGNGSISNKKAKVEEEGGGRSHRSNGHDSEAAAMATDAVLSTYGLRRSSRRRRKKNELEIRVCSFEKLKEVKKKVCLFVF